MIFLIGITKGMITIINNHAIRQVTGSSNQYLNLLHMWYAVGAFLSPFVTMLLMGAGMNWKTILRLLAVLTVLIVLSYATMDYRKIEKEEKKEGRRGARSGSRAKRKVLVLKERGIPSGSRRAVLLYGPRKLRKRMVCYLFKEHRLYVRKSCDRDGIRDLDHDHDRKDRHCFDLEEGAAGKDPGGDLRSAVCLGADPCLRGIPAMAVAALVLLGLGMAGAFPTTTAFTGDLMGNSPLGMSVFTGIGSLGGILTPQVIGVLADKLGFQAAILFLVLDALLLALFGVGALGTLKYR